MNKQNENNKTKQENVPIPEKKVSSVPNTIVEEKGINLIPTMSGEEIKKDEKKKKMNVSALISISVLLSVSILVVGFNIISKIQLNSEKEKLYEYEQRMGAYSQLMIENKEIIDRINLYKDIQEGKYPAKSVIIYVQNIASKSGTNSLVDFSFTGTESFAFSGEALDLEDVAKFWYLLINDSKIEDISLKSLSKSEDLTRFSFTGMLKLDEFVSNI